MQRFDAEVREKKMDDAPKVKKTRTDEEHEEEHTERMESQC